MSGASLIAGVRVQSEVSGTPTWRRWRATQPSSRRARAPSTMMAWAARSHTSGGTGRCVRACGRCQSRRSSSSRSPST
eukprot:3955572-Prymnesium_polylepis.1